MYRILREPRLSLPKHMCRYLGWQIQPTRRRIFSHESSKSGSVLGLRLRHEKLSAYFLLIIARKQNQLQKLISP